MSGDVGQFFINVDPFGHDFGQTGFPVKKDVGPSSGNVEQNRPDVEHLGKNVERSGTDIGQSGRRNRTDVGHLEKMQNHRGLMLDISFRGA